MLITSDDPRTSWSFTSSDSSTNFLDPDVMGVTGNVFRKTTSEVYSDRVPLTHSHTYIHRSRDRYCKKTVYRNTDSVEHDVQTMSLNQDMLSIR